MKLQKGGGSSGSMKSLERKYQKSETARYLAQHAMLVGNPLGELIYPFLYPGREFVHSTIHNKHGVLIICNTLHIERCDLLI